MGWAVAGGSPHLQHGDLHLVVAVRGVGGRDDEEAAFLVELIQQAGSRVHVCVDLHGWGERPAGGGMPVCPPSPLPYPITPSPCRAASHPQRPASLRAGPPLPRATYVHKGAGSPSTAGWTGRPAGRCPGARSPPRTGTRRWHRSCCHRRCRRGSRSAEASGQGSASLCGGRLGEGWG